jgi:lipoyl(octanoyl) transferase
MFMTSAAEVMLPVTVNQPAPGADNMRQDIELLDRCARGEIAGAVRIYGFSPPCISLGRMQTMDDVDLDACARDGVDVVRRPSGGRAVLHDQEVTYAVVCTASDPRFGGRVLESCARIHATVARGLAALGVRTVQQARPRDVRAAARNAAAVANCFAAPAAHELLDAQGRKLVGSAQARRGRGLLQHGSVLLEPPGAARYLRAGAPHDRSGGVRHLLGREVTWEELAGALEACFRAAASRA